MPTNRRNNNRSRGRRPYRPTLVHRIKYTTYTATTSAQANDQLIAEKIPIGPWTYYRILYVKVKVAARLWDSATEKAPNWGVIVARGADVTPIAGNHWVTPGAKAATTGRPITWKRRPADSAIWKPCAWSTTASTKDFDSGLDFYYSDIIGMEVTYCFEFK